MYFPNFVKKYYSIEHDAEWFKAVELKKPKNVEFHNVPWNYPRTMPTQLKQFKTYVNYIKKLNVEQFDKILIDGRARGWCAEAALQFLHKDSVVFIHDFWHRPQYHIVFNWYEEISSIKNQELQTVIALKPKSEYIGVDRIKTSIENS